MANRAIPVFVFYTAENKYIAHFTERSATAHAGLAQAMDQARTKLGLLPTATFGNLADLQRQQLLLEVIERIDPFSEQWRRDAVKEIRELLSSALGIPEVA